MEHDPKRETGEREGDLLRGIGLGLASAAVGIGLWVLLANVADIEVTLLGLWIAWSIGRHTGLGSRGSRDGQDAAALISLATYLLARFLAFATVAGLDMYGVSVELLIAFVAYLRISTSPMGVLLVGLMSWIAWRAAARA